MKFPILLSLVLVIVAATGTAQAQSDQAGATLSVAQVVQMLDQAPRNPVAHQVLVAYLAGVGEAAGVMIDMAKTPCKQPLSLSAEDVKRVMASVSVGKSAATSATPLIVCEMIARARCG